MEPTTSAWWPTPIGADFNLTRFCRSFVSARCDAQERDRAGRHTWTAHLPYLVIASTSTDAPPRIVRRQPTTDRPDTPFPAAVAALPSLHRQTQQIPTRAHGRLTLLTAAASRREPDRLAPVRCSCSRAGRFSRKC